MVTLVAGMRVIATAGHTGHGKSALVQALTGMAPGHLDEEHPGGLPAGLGHAWLILPSGDHLAFIDVPGQERFVATMAAVVGQVPAVLFVVAADQGWQALRTTRRVAIPLLEFLDRAGVTERLPDDRRRVVSPPAE
jgi:selenocysteine-specific elongation factor